MSPVRHHPLLTEPLRINQNIISFIKGNSFENVVCETVTNVFRTCFNPSGAATGIFQANQNNTLADDALAPCATRTSVTMVLTIQDEQIQVFHSDRFQLSVLSMGWKMIKRANTFWWVFCVWFFLLLRNSAPQKLSHCNTTEFLPHLSHLPAALILNKGSWALAPIMQNLLSHHIRIYMAPNLQNTSWLTNMLIKSKI